jgi:hypothetical protein
MTDLSYISTIKDVIDNADLIIKSAEISPIFDPVLKIQRNETKDDPNTIMMGDGITKNFLTLLKLEQQKSNKGCGKYLKLAPYIESDNVDLYFLKNVNLVNISINNIRNIIHNKNTIDYLILDRYLPCNRIASSSKSDIFYVSLQCLYSLLTGNCFMPKYLKIVDDFILSIYKAQYITDKIKIPCSILCDHINNQINIYERYGFTFNYVETKTILPCILSRMHD